MSESICYPDLVIKRGYPTPSIEVDNDEIRGKYASGKWEHLIAPFTANWVKRKKFVKLATVWGWLSPSVSFRHPGYSVFIAQYGLPMSYFEALQQHLAEKLGKQVRFSDDVQPSLKDGWMARIHVQDTATWIPVDAAEWMKVDA